MTSFLGKSPKPVNLGNSQIISHLGNFQNLKNIPPLKFLKEFGLSGEFPKYNLGNFPNIWESGNSLNSFFLQKYNCCRVMFFINLKFEI